VKFAVGRDDLTDVADIIYLAERAADRSRLSRGVAVFFFALECPLSYLAAERLERALGAIEWAPVISPLGELCAPGIECDREAQAQERFAAAVDLAEGLGLPLVEPEKFPMESRRASRVAVYAAEDSLVHRFVLGIARMAYCGGFDIDDLGMIAEAAAGAGLDPDEAVQAAQDPRYDLQIDATTRGLARRGVNGAPAIRIGASWFEGADPLMRLTAWSDSNQPTA